MGKRILPDFIPGSNRQWKQRKRAEFKKVVRALEVFLLGAAYTPAESWTIPELERLREMQKQLSLKQWGR